MITGASISLVLMSFLVGILVGVTSMGGAALMTPFLMLVVGVRPVLAVGTDLVYGSITKIFGAWTHCKQGTVDYRVAFRMAYGSLPGGLLGVLSLRYFHAHGVNPDSYVKHSIGVVLMIASTIMLYRTFRPKMSDRTAALVKSHEVFMTIFWGFVIGFAVGLTSVGSGSLIAPFLMLLFPNNPSRAVGTDVFHAALLVSTTALLHLQAGNVEWGLIPILLIGSLPGVLIGSLAAKRIPPRPLRLSIGLVLLLTGAKLL